MIDIHVLAHPDFPVQPMVESLNHPKIKVHVLPHIAGNILMARYTGFSSGKNPFVAWADPDDAVLDLTWVDEALNILGDKKYSAVYPRWKSTKNGKPIFEVPIHKWHPRRSHMLSLPYAHHLTIMRRSYVDAFFRSAFQKIESARSAADVLLVQSMLRHGEIYAHPAMAYEWKLRGGSTRSAGNDKAAADWAAALYIETRRMRG